MKIDEALTRKVAFLARLELTDSETTEYTKQLQDIFKHVENLSEVNVDGVEPLIHSIDLKLQMREDHAEDIPRDTEGHSKVLQSAPETLYDSYKVPPIL